MSEPFLGEIKMVSFGFAPRGWALCNGQELLINQNSALFSLLGTRFGGNGQTTFALPNLQGRVPIHAGGGFTLAQYGGEDAHTLTQGEMPAHTHTLTASAGAATAVSPANNFWADGGLPAYAGTANATLAPEAIRSAGGGQPHENRSPYTVVNFVIALAGIFPTRD